MVNLKLEKIKMLSSFDMDRYRLVGIKFLNTYDNSGRNTKDNIYVYRCLRSKDLAEGDIVLVPVYSDFQYVLAKVVFYDIEEAENIIKNKRLIEGMYDSVISKLEERDGDLRSVVYSLGRETEGQFKEYRDELERESQIKEIKAQLKKRAETAREISLYTALAQHDPMMQSLLDQLSDITGDNLLLKESRQES